MNVSIIIKSKNDRYSELTALYELWKKNDSDIKGLAHYRRFLQKHMRKKLFAQEGLHSRESENCVLFGCYYTQGILVIQGREKDFFIATVLSRRFFGDGDF